MSIANIALFPTLDGPGRGGPGLNPIYLSIMQAPQGQPLRPAARGWRWCRCASTATAPARRPTRRSVSDGDLVLLP